MSNIDSINAKREYLENEVLKLKTEASSLYLKYCQLEDKTSLNLVPSVLYATRSAYNNKYKEYLARNDELNLFNKEYPIG